MSVDASPSPATRRRRKVVTAVVLLIAGLLASFLAVTHTYRLEDGSYYGVVRPVEAEAVRAGPVTEIRVPFQRNGVVEFIASWRNGGRLPVRISELSMSDMPSDEALLQVIDVRMIGGNGERISDYTREASRPFEQVTVSPDQEIVFFVSIRMPDASVPPDGSMSFNQVFVRFTVLGVSRAEFVPLQYYVGMYGPAQR